MAMTSNPTLNPKTFEGLPITTGATMTVQGAVNKTSLLLAIVILTAGYSWNNPALAGALIPLGLIVGFIFAMITCFKMTWAPITAPIYAVCEGLALGAISAIMNNAYPGIVFQAILLTFGITAALLGAYSMRLIVATDKFKRGIFIATGGIAVYYLLTMVLGLFHIQAPGFGTSLFSIGFSLFVIVIAALNLVIDFDVIEQGAAQGAPKYMEWYSAFGLLVTLVWLYIEILRLLSKLNRRN